LLLGEDPFTIHRNTARRLVCDQPAVVERYNQLLNRQLENQRTIKNFQHFEERYNAGLINNNMAIQMLNKIDESITNSIKYAEKKCRKLKSGMVPFTPQINRAGKEINVWNNVIRKKSGCNISSTYIKRIAKKSGINMPMKLRIEDCIKERQLATKKYKRLKRNAKQSRIQFIKELAIQQSAKGNESTSNAILRINRNEELRESYKRIKSVTKPFYGATEKVLIPTMNSDEERITTEKIEIEQALCTQNKKNLHQRIHLHFFKNPYWKKSAKLSQILKPKKF